MMPPLFPDMPVRLPMPDADVTFFPAFFNAVESEDFLRRLTAEIPWRQVSICLYGKTIPVPRLTSWHGDAGAGYTYSHVELTPEPWTPALAEIRERLLALDGRPFNSVLLNYYRDGSDGVSWHSDDEPELGPAPVIADCLREFWGRPAVPIPASHPANRENGHRPDGRELFADARRDPTALGASNPEDQEALWSANQFDFSEN